jgi:nucleoside-diphosphate-sugar epimerase
VAAQVDYTIIDSDMADPDVRNFRINFAKIAGLGYRPQRSLEDGISELVRLYRWYRPGSGAML